MRIQQTIETTVLNKVCGGEFKGQKLLCVESGDITGTFQTLGDELSVVASGKQRSGIPFGLLYWKNYPTIMSWTVLKHENVGGTTLSVWNIGYSFRLEKGELEKKDIIKRCIGDYISFTNNGSVIDLKDAPSKLLQPTFLISLNTIDKVEVLSHSVFSRTGWAQTDNI